MRQRIRSGLFQIIACRLFGAKPWSEPVLDLKISSTKRCPFYLDGDELMRIQVISMATLTGMLCCNCETEWRFHSGFDFIVRPEPSGASQTMPMQPRVLSRNPHTIGKGVTVLGILCKMWIWSIESQHNRQNTQLFVNQCNHLEIDTVAKIQHDPIQKCLEMESRFVAFTESSE